MNATIEFRVGKEAFEKLEALVTNDDNDILLQVERLLKEKTGTMGAGDPFTDPNGIFVDLIREEIE